MATELVWLYPKPEHNCNEFCWKPCSAHPRSIHQMNKYLTTDQISIIIRNKLSAHTGPTKWKKIIVKSAYMAIYPQYLGYVKLEQGPESGEQLHFHGAH